jgi:hypothetical protein
MRYHGERGIATDSDGGAWMSCHGERGIAVNDDGGA